MEVLVVADSHFYRTSDGKYWAKTIYSYDFWKRYLAVFDKVAVVSRTQLVENIDQNNYLRVDGPNVRIIELPFLRGAKDYIFSYPKLRRAAIKAIKESSVAIFRLPSVVSTIVLDFYKKTGNPYSIEIVADPYDAYSSNLIAQKYFTKKLKQSALDSNGVSYVTKKYLQSKYPSGSSIYGESNEKFETYYSTIDLKHSFFYQPRLYNNITDKFTIVHTANSINNYSKGHKTVLKVAKNLTNKSIDVNVIFIGDGSKREEFENLAEDYGIGDKVTFTGLLPTTTEVRNYLLKADLFLFPTQAEGLPRAVIEAMAVGLPCLSTPVNGIPELLDEEYLFFPEDVNGFTEKIVNLICNPDKLEIMSETNIKRAKEYTNDKLKVRRNDFYYKLYKLSKKKL